jgi:hypothetical protein
VKRLVLCATVALRLSGQTLASPEEAQAITARAGKAPLDCVVEAIKPVFALNSRLQSGYVYRASAEGSVTALLRVTPAGASPVHLTERTAAAASGTFFLGEGQYGFHLLLVDDRGRSCAKDWQLEASARGAKLAIAPGAVLDLALHGALPAKAAAGRLSILLEAAPIAPGVSAPEEPVAWNGGRRSSTGREPLARQRSAGVLSPGDQTLLLGALSAVVERLPAAETRLVVFNLAQQRELYRGERFTLDSLPAVAEALRNTQLASVDYRVLVNPSGYQASLAKLINEELRAAPAAGGAVFLGPHELFAGDFPGKLIDGVRGAAPPFFRLAYEVATPLTLGPSAITVTGADVQDDPAAGRAMLRGTETIATMRPDWLADPVTQAIRKLGGKSYAIQSPRQFARAVEEIRRRLVSSRPASDPPRR